MNRAQATALWDGGKLLVGGLAGFLPHWDDKEARESYDYLFEENC